MTSPSDIADLLRPGAIVPVDPQTTQRLVQALRDSLTSRSDKQTGGPAFPLHNHGAQTLGMHLSGMTLRDYFAAKAMLALIHKNYFDVAAKEAYQMADAMLKARDGTQ